MAALIVGLVLLTVVVGPVRSAMMRADYRAFQTQSALIRQRVVDFRRTTTELAAQVGSRSAIREELVRYHNGLVDADSYRAFAAPKLADAAHAAPEIIAITRLAPDGSFLVQAEGTPRGPQPTLLSADGILITHHPGSDGEQLVVTAPITDPIAGLVGYDVVTVSTHSLRVALREAAALFDPSTLRLYSDTGELLSIGESPSTGYPRRETGSSIPGGWRLVLYRDARILHQATNTFIALLSLGIVAGAALLYASLRVTLAVLHREVLQRSDALEELVTQRTEQLQHALEGRKLLLREVHHRIKNDLAMVNSILSLAGDDTLDSHSRSVMETAAQRVRTMARIYDQLYRSDGHERVRLPTLINSIVESSASTAVTSSVEDIDLDRQIAVPVGIIVNELVINAHKYGHHPGAEADIHVRVTSHANTTLQIDVSDCGPGFLWDTQLADETAAGFGLFMVESLARRFGGSFAVVTPQDGCGSTVRVELALVLTPGTCATH